MRSASFGRRIIEPGGRELVLVPGLPEPSPAHELPGHDELKEQIRAVLMSRIDPSVAGRIPRSTLRAEVARPHGPRGQGRSPGIRRNGGGCARGA
jgi:hypothetical protein